MRVRKVRARFPFSVFFNNFFSLSLFHAVHRKDTPIVYVRYAPHSTAKFCKSKLFLCHHRCSTGNKVLTIHFLCREAPLSPSQEAPAQLLLLTTFVNRCEHGPISKSQTDGISGPNISENTSFQKCFHNVSLRGDPGPFSKESSLNQILYLCTKIVPACRFCPCTCALEEGRHQSGRGSPRHCWAASPSRSLRAALALRRAQRGASLAPA